MGWTQTGLEIQAFHTLAIQVWRWQCSVAHQYLVFLLGNVFLALGWCCSAAAFVLALSICVCGRLSPVGGVTSLQAGLMLVGAIRLKRRAWEIMNKVGLCRPGTKKSRRNYRPRNRPAGNFRFCRVKRMGYVIWVLSMMAIS